MKFLKHIIPLTTFVFITFISFGQTTSDKNANAHSYRLLAEDYLENDNYAEAIEYFRKAVYEFSNPNHKDLANIYNNITRCYIGLKIDNDALQNCLKALRLAKLHDIKPELIYSYNYLGIIKYNLDDDKDALDNYFKALEISQQSNGNKALEANIINNIGATYDALGNKEKALKYLKQSLELKLKLEDSDEAIRTLNNLARVYFKQHNIEQSLKTYSKSLELYKLDNSVEEIGATYLGFGDVYYHIKNTNQALEYAKKTLDFSILNNDVYLKKEAYKLISKCLDKDQQYKEALKYHKLYFKLNDSINTAKKAKQLVELKTVYEKEKQDKKINLLKKENELKDLKIKSSQNLLYLSLIALILLAVFALILYRNIKKYKAANKDLVRMNLDAVAADKKLNEIPNLLALPVEKKQTNDTSSSVLTDNQKSNLLNKLLPLFEDQKIFLEHDLTILKVAERLNTNKSYVSHVINDSFNKNFNTFVNEYRVNEARALLSKPENWNLKIESIGHSVGFKSKSAFYKAFKKYTGITPSFFLSTVKSDQL